MQSAKPCWLVLMAFITLAMLQMPAQLATGSVQEDYSWVGIGRKEVIPQNLPWYPLIVFGDNRPEDVSSVKQPPVFIEIVKEMKLINPLAVVGTGDHVGSGRIDQMIEFTRIMSSLINVWVIEGNHDIGTADALAWWHEHIAPKMYFKDDFPGWRIVFVSTEISYGEYQALRNFLDDALNTTRKVIIVLHKPIEPDLEHNAPPEIKNMVKSAIQKYGNVELVMQGHWHGYAAVDDECTKYVVTGGAGAPLYQSGGKHHYIILTLWSNGTYSMIPVSAEDGEIKIIHEGNSTIIINTKEALDGKPTPIPVRVRLQLSDGVPAYAVINALPGATELQVKDDGSKIEAVINATTSWYLYIPVYPNAIMNSSTGASTLSLDYSNLIPVTITEWVTRTEITTVTVTIRNTVTKTVESTITTTQPLTATKTITSTATNYETITTTLTETQEDQQGLIRVLGGLAIGLVIGAGLAMIVIRSRQSRVSA